jgi:predicted RNA-binding Zn ribbon-like protein
VIDCPTLPHRVAGNLALDFANTYSWRGTPREVDHLVDGGAILAWAKDAGLVDSRLTISPARQALLVEKVHHLRRAIEAVGVAIARRTPPPAQSLATIRDLASQSLAAASLVSTPVRLDFVRDDRIVGPIAWAALDLLRGVELGRLKQCPPEDCRWLFIDRTKNGSRRWCEMATCGNRAKKRRADR